MENEERDRHAVQNRLHDARLPRMKTLEEFDFNQAPQIPAAKVRELAEGGPTRAGNLTQPVHACPRFGRFPDLLVDAAPGMFPETPQGFFKKSISIACWPILRSSSAIRSVSRRPRGRAPLPGNASSPLARHSPFQVSNRLGLS